MSQLPLMATGTYNGIGGENVRVVSSAVKGMSYPEAAYDDWGYSDYDDDWGGGD